MSSIGTRVRAHRVAAGLNQRELADAVGCHSSFISRLESGGRGASKSFILAIIRVCDLSMPQANDLLLAGGFAPLLDMHLVASYTRRTVRMDDEYRARFEAVWRDSREEMAA
jgi:transcriptional regulator with XRE-family HTH domain